MTRNREALALTVGLTSITTVLWVAALQLRSTAAAVPLTVAVPTLLLFFTLLVTDTRAASTPASPEATSGRRAGHLAGRELSTIGWMAALLAMMWALGVLIALPSYLLLHLRVRSGERWATAIAAAVATWWLLYVVLGLLLRMELAPGWVWPWLAPS